MDKAWRDFLYGLFVIVSYEFVSWLRERGRERHRRHREKKGQKGVHKQ